MPIPDALTQTPKDVLAGAPSNVTQIYQTLGCAIKDSVKTMPDFDFAVDRHKLLSVIEQSSTEGGKTIAL